MRPPPHDDDLSDALAREREVDDWIRERRYRAALLRHPNCNDPDHPGCPDCDESNSED